MRVCACAIARMWHACCVRELRWSMGNVLSFACESQLYDKTSHLKQCRTVCKCSGDWYISNAHRFFTASLISQKHLQCNLVTSNCMLYLHSDILTCGVGCETYKGAVFQWFTALASFDRLVSLPWFYVASGQRNVRVFAWSVDEAVLKAHYYIVMAVFCLHEILHCHILMFCYTIHWNKSCIVTLLRV